MNAATVGVSLAPKRKNVLTSKTKLKKLKLTAQVEAKKKAVSLPPMSLLSLPGVELRVVLGSAAWIARNWGSLGSPG